MSVLLKADPDHPYRRTSWRWERARLLLEHGLALPGRNKDDRWVEKAYFLRKSLRAARTELDRFRVIQDAGPVGTAYQLWDQEDRGPVDTPSHQLIHCHSGRHELEARLLTDTPLEETAERVGTSREAVGAYEAIYFNVLDRMKARSYIAQAAIGGTLHDGTTRVPAVW